VLKLKAKRIRGCSRDPYSTSMYEVRQAGAKGLGVFAKARIPCGTRIFSERPTLAIGLGQGASDIYTASRLLSFADRFKLLQLSSHIASPLLRWAQILGYTAKQLFLDLKPGPSAVFVPSRRSLREHMTILSIFRTNAFSLEESSKIHQAVFADVARLNHSCVPNAQGNFHDALGCFNVHATRDIAAEEELTINYLPENGYMQEVRQKSLLDGYGFACECPACDLTTPRGKAGEARRGLMKAELGAFAQSVTISGERSAQAELETIQSYIQLYEQEGIAGRELSSM
jgi:hypothetical protein